MYASEHGLTRRRPRDQARPVRRCALNTAQSVLAPTDVPQWEPQDENCKLVAVRRGTDEWGRIQAQLQASLPGAQIVQVCSKLVLSGNG